MFTVVATFLALCTINATANDSEKYPGYVGKRLMKDDSSCAVLVETSVGKVCGTMRASYNGASYASFRGVPYAQQPLGELRFVAPKPLEPWAGYFNASIEGPICPQRDVLYGPLLQPNSMSEDCLAVNVHVPAAALPSCRSKNSSDGLLPVLVIVPGGGFEFGSGDSDLYGPEYMIDQNIVVITLNYRLGPFGFLSLNSSSVPGNAGLRDIITALEWVQTNVRAFGGDPDHVTLMGQSAGGSSAHLLSLSETTHGLFTKLILMSGYSSAGYYSPEPSYAQFVRSSFLEYLGINSTDVDEILQQLNELPYEAILDANSYVLQSLGLCVFNPVVESQIDGVTRILDDDPDVLVASGRGIRYPLLMGFTNVECESIRRRLEDTGIISQMQENPTAILPPKLLFSASQEVQATAASQMFERYINGTPTMDQYMPACSDSLIIYPALKLAETRAATGGEPVFLYRFSYDGDSAPIKRAFGLNYTGAGHMDDLTYVTRVNSILHNTRLDTRDRRLKDWMTTIFSNFIRCSNPTCDARGKAWPAASRPLRYQDISGPAYAVSHLTKDQREMIQLFDSFYQV